MYKVLKHNFHKDGRYKYVIPFEVFKKLQDARLVITGRELRGSAS